LYKNISGSLAETGVTAFSTFSIRSNSNHAPNLSLSSKRSQFPRTFLPHRMCSLKSATDTAPSWGRLPSYKTLDINSEKFYHIHRSEFVLYSNAVIFTHQKNSMKIPNANHAIIDIQKLRDYCLNPAHDEGKHKARLFAAALGMAADDAEDLREMLYQAVMTQSNAQLGRRDEYGQRYVLDIMIERRGKRAMIRSGWIIEHGKDIPRLTTRYPL
jgi:hypothetical protein